MSGAVLFDFDGTLVDTFDGIVEAVQRLRAELSAGPLPPHEIQRHIGWGLGHLLAQCHPRLDARRPNDLPLPGGPSSVGHDELSALILQFRRIYGRVMMIGARVYPGVAPLCCAWAARGIALGVVSNKPERFVRQILAAMALADPFGVVLGGDSLPVRKPDPEPLRHAARQLGAALERSVMVGDGNLDIEAAAATGIPSCGVTWGLLSAERMRELGATHIVHTADELATCLEACGVI